MRHPCPGFVNGLHIAHPLQLLTLALDQIELDGKAQQPVDVPLQGRRRKIPEKNPQSQITRVRVMRKQRRITDTSLPGARLPGNTQNPGSFRQSLHRCCEEDFGIVVLFALL
ncbi:hypothetical protein SDC9_172284 [bioreactor metagenome]|uniref:Uncharacterized protein n=1 Tax=bioreactor metagenome TaxID=1076179 RepID=A0A645GGG9_9ZZZZ